MSRVDYADEEIQEMYDDPFYTVTMISVKTGLPNSSIYSIINDENSKESREQRDRYLDTRLDDLSLTYFPLQTIVSEFGVERCSVYEDGGVYFLCHKGVVVYIGMVGTHDRGPGISCIYNRLGDHAITKEFDSFIFLPLKEDLRTIALVERYFIDKFQPRYNNRMPAEYVIAANYDRIEQALTANGYLDEDLPLNATEQDTTPAGADTA